MDGINKMCNEWVNSLYTTRQSWVDSHYHTIIMMKKKHGWDVVVNLINEKTGMGITNKKLRDNILISKKRVGDSCIIPDSKELVSNQKKIVTVEKKPVTNLSIFDAFTDIWQSTKEKLSENGYTPKDFKRIGIEGIKDGATIDRLVDQAIGSEKKEQGSQFATQFFKKD